MATVSVRYIVDDVDAAIAFYTRHLDFDEVMHPAPTFAMLSRGDLRLTLSAPSGAGGGGQAMPDGARPEPGGWNRFSLDDPTSKQRSNTSAQPAFTSVTKSSPASAANRYCSTTPPATRSSSSNQPGRKPH